MITGLAHVCFTVPDLERSIDFYCNKLGLAKAFDFLNDEGERFGVYLQLGGRNFLELFQGGPDRPGPGSTYSHLCLEVADIEAAVAGLRSHGVEVTDATLGCDNSWQAWLSDPDGNRIELHAYTPKSWQAPFLK